MVHTHEDSPRRTGDWRLESGKWRVESGEWRVEIGDIPRFGDEWRRLSCSRAAEAAGAHPRRIPLIDH